MRNESKNNRVKGSVLYTVVAVMMIMTIFIFAALALASAANRRAFNSYANNQTQYTARSVVETIWEQIESTPELAEKIVDLKDSMDIEVTLPDKSMGEVTKATVTYLGKGTTYGYDVDDNFYKLSVTVKLLGQENTIAGYFLPEKIDNFAFDYALVSLDSASSNNFDVYGPICYGASTSSEGWKDMSNDGKLSAPINYNGDLGIQHADNINIKQNTGIFVNGNFRFNNGGNLTPSINSLKYYRDLPYLYITKMFEFNSTPTKIGISEAPMLVMAGAIEQNMSTEHSIFGDVYLYGSDVSIVGLNRIKQWNSDLIEKKDNGKPLGYKSYTGGNLYSLGTVNAEGTDGSEGILANNVVVNTLNFNTNANAYTTGAVVAENVNISSGSNYTFSNGLFVDPDRFTCNNNLINNQPYVAAEIVGHYEPITSVDVPTIYNPDFNSEVVNIIYKGDGAKEFFINYDFSDYIPLSAPNPRIKLKSITIETQRMSYAYYDYDKLNLHSEIYKKIGEPDVFSDNPETENDVNIDIGATSTVQIDNMYTDAPKGKVSIYIEPSKDGFSNWKQDIYINSITASFEISTNNYIEETVYNTDNVEFLRAVNDISFNNNGDVIYIDDIDKSVKVEKFTDTDGFVKLKISKADLTSVEEGNELTVSYDDVGIYYYDTQYADFLHDVVSTVSFPDSMKKDNVLRSNGGFVDDSFLNSWGGVSEIESNAETEVTNAFEHIDETVNLIYDFTSDKKITKTDGEVYTEEDIIFPLEVNSSCTFTGYLGANDYITIIPSSDKIYIKLDGFGMNDVDCQGKNMIIVDDDKGTKRVNFLIPKNNDVTIIGNILTKYYSENTEILQDPIKYDTIMKKHVVDSEKIPGIYFYMEYDKDNMAKLEFKYSHTSAYIIAPTGILEANDHGNERIYTYNGNVLDEMSNAIIGAAIFKIVHPSANDRRFFYVNPNPKLDEDIEEELSYETRCIYYQCY